jgi:hypothetical protein
MAKVSKESDKQIKAYLKECARLKGAVLREAYAQVVGRDTNETNRERLLNGIARILYHNAGQGALVPIFEHPEMGAKSEPKKEGKREKGKNADTAQSAFSDGESDAGPSSGSDIGGGARDDAKTDAAADATASATGVDGDGGDEPRAPSDAANGADIANAGATVGDSDGGSDGGTKRRVMRPRGERDLRLPPPGTVLAKTYKGAVHKVTLLQDNGCLYEGKQYKSLSGVAKAIAGCNHNGLLFFGLIKREPKAKAPDASTSVDADGAQAE